MKRSVVIRPATVSDVEPIAAIHADSWRRHYRGEYTDDFLDRDVTTDRLSVWRERLNVPEPNTRTLVAEREGHVVGFAHLVIGADPEFGTLLDNLHVAYASKGTGVGTALLRVTAETVMAQAEETGLYLWVIEQNMPAREFYRSRGGICVGSELGHPGPDGIRHMIVRYSWPDASVLVAGSTTPS